MFNRLNTFFFTITFALCFVVASPVATSSNGTTIVNLEKRIDHSGQGTWFYPGMGNCGKRNTQYDDIVAISKTLYDSNKGGNCDQYVEIVNVKNGKTARGLTRDSCPSCGYDDLDMSPSLFKKLGTLDQGVISIKWHFLKK